MELEKTLEELQADATGLGIKFHPNTGEAKLKEKIEAFYESQSAGDLVEMIEDESEGGEEDEEKIDTPVVTKRKKLTKEQKFRKIVSDAKVKAMKKRVVTVSSNDKRDNDVTTVAYLGFENQYFGISKLVPLDIPIELEACLIEIAKTTMITLHKDEIIEGKRTGNKTPVAVRKLSVSFEDMSV
jgi:hypothetical protein